MIRRTPLETTQIELPSGQTLTVPTDDETLRIKAFLIVRRNQTRDYLDVAALAERVGIESAAWVLRDIDRYYTDQRGPGDGVATQVFRQLSDPRPKDSSTIRELTRYKNLDSRWHEWSAVVTSNSSCTTNRVTVSTSAETMFDSRSTPPPSNSCSRSRAITDGATLRIGLLLSSVH